MARLQDVPSHRRPILPVARGLVVLMASLPVVFMPGPVTAQDDWQLGTIEFPNSGAAAAQDDFIRGVLLLHSFEYDDAADAFRAAQAADPDFTLAYWGEAMTYNHPLWAEQDREAAREALSRYHGTPATDREGLYLEAVRALYGEGDKTARDEAYMRAMRRLHEAHPDDAEARVFYALSLLGLTDGVRDFANYMRGAAVAQPVFEANPEHPGAAHYLIHAFDDPIHAPLGLPAARAYGPTAPDAGHAQHMTSHIFLAMGMWDDVIRANVNATRVADRNRERRNPGSPLVRCGHYPYWLAYGHLMREEWTAAAEILDVCQENQEDPSLDVAGYYVFTRGRQILDSEDWDGAERWTAEIEPSMGPGLVYHFVNAYADWQRGDVSMARQMHGHMSEMEELDPRAEIVRLELGAMVDRAEGRNDAAVEQLRAAARLEESLPMEFGPPASVKPPHEMLGEVLLALDRPGEAVEAFRGSLALTPRRTPSLRGLAAAYEGSGESRLAEETRREIREIVAGGAS